MVSVNIKASNEQKYVVEIELTQTVSELKEEVAKLSDVEAAQQRLIFSGKVLKDEEVLETYKIKDGNTIHMVKSAKTSSSSGAGNTASGNSSAAAIPPLQAGSGVGNPFAALTGAQTAGMNIPLPSRDLFGPDGGMGAPPSMQDMQEMMRRPEWRQQMQWMLQQPQMVEAILSRDPQLRGMAPMMRQMLQSPEFLNFMTDPNMMQSMASMREAMQSGSLPAFPAPGATNTTPVAQGGADTNSATTDTNANPATAPLFNPFMNPFAFLGNSQTTAQPEDSRPPEERYATQLGQLNDMGFVEYDRNIAALQRSGGNVHSAIEMLLNGSI